MTTTPGPQSPSAPFGTYVGPPPEGPFLSRHEYACWKPVYDGKGGCWPCAGPHDHWGDCAPTWPTEPPENGHADV